MRLIIYVTLILCISCSDEDSLSDETIECMSITDIPEDWFTYVGLNGVSITLPTQISNEYQTNDTLLSSEIPGVGISMGHCNLFGIPDINTSCFYESFHPLDSISLIVPDSIVMLRQISQNNIPLRYKICNDDLTVGALYLRDFIIDAPIVYGQLYLPMKIHSLMKQLNV